MSKRMWILLAILAVLAVLSFSGYRTMIAVKSGLEVQAPTGAHPGKLEALQDQLMSHIRILGGSIGERHLERPESLQAAIEYIRGVWTDQGLPVSEERFEVNGQSAVNLIVERKGSERPDEIVLVGAHYDTAPGTPGANDNGTGVALLLEMARTLKDTPTSRTLRFVAFANEEPPYFFSEQMGSRVHARGARQRGERIAAMLSLETLGYYVPQDGTQRYPFPLGLFYPRTGNFLAVVGNIRSRPLVVDFLRHFMASSTMPVEGAAAFGWIPGVYWSDHWSFWKEGYPAIMLTDTAPFRYPDYHDARDLPDRITAPEYARAAHGIIQAVRALVNAREDRS